MVSLLFTDAGVNRREHWIVSISKWAWAIIDDLTPLDRVQEASTFQPKVLHFEWEYCSGTYKIYKAGIIHSWCVSWSHPYKPEISYSDQRPASRISLVFNPPLPTSGAIELQRRMCLWREYIHRNCGHLTRTELNPTLETIFPLRKRCDLYRQRQTTNSQQEIGLCPIQFVYDEIRLSTGQPWAHPDYYVTQFETLGITLDQLGRPTGECHMSCYFPSCRGEWDIESYPDDAGWGRTRVFSKLDFEEQPRFRIPKPGHSWEEMQEYMWMEIIHCQRFQYWARRYAFQTDTLRLNLWKLQELSSHRNQFPLQSEAWEKANVAFEKFNLQVGSTLADTELLLHWLRQIWDRRLQDLRGSPYVCVDGYGRYGLCSGALKLDLGCRCNGQPAPMPSWPQHWVSVPTQPLAWIKWGISLTT